MSTKFADTEIKNIKKQLSRHFTTNTINNISPDIVLQHMCRLVDDILDMGYRIRTRGIKPRNEIDIDNRAVIVIRDGYWPNHEL